MRSVPSERSAPRLLALAIFTAALCSATGPLAAGTGCGGICDPLQPSELPQLCMHSPLSSGNGVSVVVTLTCPQNTIARAIKVPGDQKDAAPDNPSVVLEGSFTFAQSFSSSSCDDPGIVALGTCIDPDTKALKHSPQREFWLALDDGSQGAAPQPVIWTDTGPDGVVSGTVQVAVGSLGEPFDAGTAVQVQAGTELGDGGSLLLGMTWAESSATAGGGETDHLLADLSYSKSLWRSQRFEISAFFGPGWSFSHGAAAVDTEGLTAHFGLASRFELSRRAYWTVTPRVRWFESLDQRELVSEVAFGVGIRFERTPEKKYQQ